jgi:pyruvate/2-oxoglutarate/acetoin dehydrogenase E1 component
MPTVLDRLNTCLHDVMEQDPKVYILGEDILDPYGGAFKVTKGLSTSFPDRVITTPISEAGIVGLATGMAMRGLRPVVEIMFGDFLTLAADQLINHAAKFQWIYNEQVHVPIVIRTPMGGHRGYGPTHSQSLEKLFLGIPGLKVIAPNSLTDPALLLKNAIEDNAPVIFIEHKLLYSKPTLEEKKGELVDFQVESYENYYPSLVLRPPHKAKITIACYGYNFELVREAAIQLMLEREIFSDIVLFTQLSPFHLDALYSSLASTKKLITVEEGTKTLGWGAEVICRVSEKMIVESSRLAARDLPIANARNLEELILPTKDMIIQAAEKLVG